MICNLCCTAYPFTMVFVLYCSKGRVLGFQTKVRFCLDVKNGHPWERGKSAYNYKYEGRHRSSSQVFKKDVIVSGKCIT